LPSHAFILLGYETLERFLCFLMAAFTLLSILKQLIS
jgi:hypothetical protein